MFSGDEAAAMASKENVVEVYELAGRYVGVEGAQAAPVAPPDPYKDLMPEQRYVAQLAEKKAVCVWLHRGHRLAARGQGARDRRPPL
jgi:hypothetical protein